MSQSRFRRVALSLPDAIEGSHQGHADFRVGERIFAGAWTNIAPKSLLKLHQKMAR